MNLVIDVNQERLGLPELAGPIPAPNPLVLVDFGESVGKFAERLGLPSTTAAALVLRSCGLSHAEVANELGLSEDQAIELIIGGIRQCVQSLRG